jgi:hypothetical protein
MSRPRRRSGNPFSTADQVLDEFADHFGVRRRDHRALALALIEKHGPIRRPGAPIKWTPEIDEAILVMWVGAKDRGMSAREFLRFRRRKSPGAFRGFTEKAILNRLSTVLRREGMARPYKRRQRKSRYPIT